MERVRAGAKRLATTVTLVGWGLTLAQADELPERFHDSPLAVVDPGGRSCAIRGSICLAPISPSTIEVESEPVASRARAEVVPRFARAAHKRTSPGDAWLLSASAWLKQPAYAGNTLFVFYDAEDAEAVANHECTALYQARVKAGRSVAAEVALTLDEGFRPGHAYRLQIVQIINHREVLLAEGNFALLQ